MPPHDGDNFEVREVFYKDCQGNLQMQPVPIPNVEILTPAYTPEEIHDYLPPLENTDQSIVISGKLAEHIIEIILKDQRRGRKRRRDLIRKKERYRRARLKYGDLDRKTRLAELMVEVAEQRLQRWKEGL